MLLASIEKILNRSLPRSPRAQALAVALAGRSLAVQMPGASPMVVSSTGACIRIRPGSGAPADASISAGPFSLLALAAGRAATPGTGGTISGDAEVAQQFSELLGLLKPDPEKSWRSWSAMRRRIIWVAWRAPPCSSGIALRATTVRNVAEYLAHERRDLVPKGEGRQLLEGDRRPAR